MTLFHLVRLMYKHRPVHRQCALWYEKNGTKQNEVCGLPQVSEILGFCFICYLTIMTSTCVLMSSAKKSLAMLADKLSLSLVLIWSQKNKKQNKNMEAAKTLNLTNWE